MKIYTGPETPLGAEGDQYALASMTYEWLSGTSTYHGTGVEVVFQRMTRPPVPLREHVPTLASAIETVVMRGLEKRAARRFASIQAFAEAFEQACAAGITEVAVDRPAQGVEVSTPQETAEWTYSYASLKVEQLERQPFSSGFSYATHTVKTIWLSLTALSCRLLHPFLLPHTGAARRLGSSSGSSGWCSAVAGPRVEKDF